MILNYINKNFTGKINCRFFFSATLKLLCFQVLTSVQGRQSSDVVSAFVSYVKSLYFEPDQRGYSHSAVEMGNWLVHTPDAKATWQDTDNIYPLVCQQVGVNRAPRPLPINVSISQQFFFLLKHKYVYFSAEIIQQKPLFRMK